MVDRETVLKLIQDQSIIAILRTDDAKTLIPIAEALFEGGIRVIEFSLTTPGSLYTLREARATLPPELVLGVGTALSPAAVDAAIQAGAQLVVTPIFNPDAVRLCRRYGVVAIPGAFTPTEIQLAWETGGDLIKVFPASTLGAGFFKAMQGPLPQIPLVAVGGICLENMASYIQAGAVAVGMGSSLAPSELITTQDWPAIAELARLTVQKMSEITS
jgi:2-dehydro-3-deoxyphosphogluconate aldolase / (4S)-4-hydroxy-2-oxoglutarate aldolase